MSKSPQPSTADLPHAPGVRILRARDAKVWSDAYRFLTEANAEADRIRESARAIVAAASTRGYHEGRARGADDAAKLVSETVGKVDRYLSSLEHDAADLALRIVRRVLGEFDDAELVARAAAHVLSDFRREKWLKITVHPDVVDHVRKRLAPLGDGPTLVIEADPNLDRTSCVVASEFVVVDASTAVQLEAIAAALTSPTPPTAPRSPLTAPLAQSAAAPPVPLTAPPPAPLTEPPAQSAAPPAPLAAPPVQPTAAPAPTTAPLAQATAPPAWLATPLASPTAPPGQPTAPPRARPDSLWALPFPALNLDTLP
jgi:type III secretion protein L